MLTIRIFHLILLVIIPDHCESAEHKAEGTNNIDFRVVRAHEQVRLSHKNCRNDSQWSVSATGLVVQPFFAATPLNAHRYVCFNEHKSGLLRIIYMDDEFNMSLHDVTTAEHGQALHITCSVGFWMLYHFGVISLKIYQGDQMLLETAQRTQIGKKTELHIDGFVEVNFYRGNDFKCVWSLQDFADYQPIEHTISTTSSILITMAARNVKPSRLEAKVGDAIQCLYDGFPAAHTVIWSQESLTDIYETLKNKRSVEEKEGGKGVDGGEGEDGGDDGDVFTPVRLSGAPNETSIVRMYQSGSVLMRCSVNNSQNGGGEAHWKGHITIEALDVYDTEVGYNEMLMVKRGDVVSLKVPQCSSDVIWVNGKEEVGDEIRVYGSRGFSKRYFAIQHGIPCGAVNLIIIEKALHLTYPRKPLLTLEDDLTISCSVSGWFDVIKNNDLSLYLNGTKEVQKVVRKWSRDKGVTTLVVRGDLKHTFLGVVRVVCRWSYEDISRANYVQEEAIQLDIWMPIKWVHPSATTAKENSTIKCLHLSYPPAHCAWQSSKNDILRLPDRVGSFYGVCNCNNSYKDQKSFKEWQGSITTVSKDSHIKSFVRNHRIEYEVGRGACRSVAMVMLLVMSTHVIMI